MVQQHALNIIKKALVFFWAIWFTVVFLSNLANLLRVFAILPKTFMFYSGNFAMVTKVISIYHLPHSFAVTLFILVILLEACIMLSLWFAAFSYLCNMKYIQRVNMAFLISMFLWMLFLITDEIFIAYRFEAAHFKFFVAQLVTLLVIHLLPDDHCKKVGV